MNASIQQLLESPELNRKMFFPYQFDDIPPSTFPVTCDDGTVLRCVYFPVKNPKKTIIRFYGNGETTQSYIESDLIDIITKSFDCSLLIVEYRGYGASEGTPSFLSMINDVSAVIKTLNLPHQDLVINGRSVGGFPLYETISRFPDVAGLIVEASYSALSPFIKKRYNITEEQAQELDTYFNIREKLSAFQGKSLIFHCKKDELVPHAHALKLQEYLGDNCTLISFGRGDHNFLPHASRQKYYAQFSKFLNSLPR